MTFRPLNIAFVTTNNAKDYSGGRYHALIMAYAAAAGGARVRFITNKRPTFTDDLEPLAPGGVEIVLTDDFRTGVSYETLDYLVLVPTGIFHPNFYEAALELAAERDARLALINFESVNWFNTVSPAPRDPRLWDYWRRVVMDGGLVLSSARISDRYARDFYRSVGGNLRFEIAPPAINSPAADQWRDVEGGESVAAFVRSRDVHKGGDDLLRIDPTIMSGRTLHVISGGDFDPEFMQALHQHYRGSDVLIQPHQRVSDVEKFRLLSHSKALLFPSRFEGFGYPPVEAAYAGAETAAYDLPVLRETVGKVAHLAPVGDVDALGAALAKALQMPPRRAELRAAVAGLASFTAVSERLSDVLWRSRDAVAPVAMRDQKIVWGPRLGAEPRTLDEFDPLGPIEPLPPRVVSCKRSAAGDLLVSLSCYTPSPVTAVDAVEENALSATALVAPGESVGGFASQTIYLAVAAAAVDQPLTLVLSLADGSEDELPVSFGMPPWSPPPLVEISLDIIYPSPEGARVFGRLNSNLTTNRLIVAFDDGRAVDAVLEPDGAFEVVLPEGAELEAGASWYVFDGLTWIDLLDGFLPQADFRRRSFVPARVFPPQPLRFQIDGTNDDFWTNGVASFHRAPRLGAVSLRPDAVGAIRVGDVLRFASGRLRRVAEVEEKRHAVSVFVDQTLSPVIEGYPNSVEVLPDPARDTGRPVAIYPMTGGSWMNGVLALGGSLSRRGILLDTPADAVPIGSALVFPVSGPRDVIGVQPIGNRCAAWLSDSISLLEDGGAQTLQLLTERSESGVFLSAASRALGAPSNRVRLKGEQIDAVRRGSVLRTQAGKRRRVVATTPARGGIDVELDGALQIEGQEIVEIDRPTDRLDGGVGSEIFYHTPHEVGGLYLQLMRAVRADGLHMPPPGAKPSAERPRVLFVTPVPMTPVNQGNRVVTFRMVAHFVELGYDVDVVLQGGDDPYAYSAQFGDRVRVVATPFPDWVKAESAQVRRSILDRIAAGNFDEIDKSAFDALRHAASFYHPYFMVSDETAQAAVGLFKRYKYSAVICNYTHMIRVAKELQALGPLPPVVVVTHDALSRLPLDFEGRRLDTMYRYCPPEVERDVLNAVPNAHILAISESERDYFRDIGVERPILLCEYDGLSEVKDAPIAKFVHKYKRLIFHASSNPMNVAALNWFVEHCWRAVLNRVPDAKLTVCGSISRVWRLNFPNVEILGELGRGELMELLRRSSIAINPTVAGTGLKIKTVEAACLGLPSVCLPHAVDGLEAVAGRFAIVAETAAEFIEGCVLLLNDKKRWLRLREGALEVAAERFDSEPVYREMDEAIGLREGVAERLAASRRAPDSEAGQGGGFDLNQLNSTAQRTPEELAGLGLRLAAAGLDASAAPLLERAVLEQVGDPEVALEAGRIALAKSNGWAAAVHGATVAATDPGDPRGYALMARGFMACNQNHAANDALVQALQVGPADPEIAELAASVRKMMGRPATLPFGDNPAGVSLALGQPAAFDAASGLTSFGWSKPEEWGCWTVGRMARLVLKSMPIPGLPLSLRLWLHATPGVHAEDQQVRVFVDGVQTVVLDLPRDDTSAPYDIALPEGAFADQGRLVLDFWIADPGPRREDGLVVDSRPLGVAMSGLMLVPTEAPAAAPVAKRPRSKVSARASQPAVAET